RGALYRPAGCRSDHHEGHDAGAGVESHPPRSQWPRGPGSLEERGPGQPLSDHDAAAECGTGRQGSRTPSPNDLDSGQQNVPRYRKSGEHLRAGSPGTIKRNPLGQVSEIMQDGWQLSFTWTEKNALQRLNMNRSTDGQDIDIRLVFDLLND
ncbi:MAG: hypothetical protein RIR83_937, partial [Pseudomonadota bacterium]